MMPVYRQVEMMNSLNVDKQYITTLNYGFSMLVRRPADSRVKSGDLTHRGKLENPCTNADISSLQTSNRYLVVS